jgi:hypothetical protein
MQSLRQEKKLEFQTAQTNEISVQVDSNSFLNSMREVSEKSSRYISRADLKKKKNFRLFVLLEIWSRSMMKKV